MKKHQNIKLSVIIPVYNTSPEYLKVAIQSVLNQSLKGIELILVDDGSTNRTTVKFLNSLDKNKIRVMSQTNQGQGEARNLGISLANGEYITFLDSDDYIDPNFYEQLYNRCINEKADIACGILCSVKGTDKKDIDNYSHKIAETIIEKMKDIKHGSCCNKIFHRSLFKTVRFPCGIYMEDNIALIKALLKSKKVIFDTTVRYYYRDVQNSTTRDIQKSEKREKDTLVALQMIQNIVQNYSDAGQKAVWDSFLPILVNQKRYLMDKQYRQKVSKILPQKILKSRFKNLSNFVQSLFSIRNSFDKKYKVITICFVQLKFKRKK